MTTLTIVATPATTERYGLHTMPRGWRTIDPPIAAVPCEYAPAPDSDAAIPAETTLSRADVLNLLAYGAKRCKHCCYPATRAILYEYDGDNGVRTGEHPCCPDPACHESVMGHIRAWDNTYLRTVDAPYAVEATALLASMTEEERDWFATTREWWD